MQQRIVCAAIRNSNGEVICSPRHYDKVMLWQILSSRSSWKPAEQGFVDQRGAFLSREEALAIAQENGQMLRRCGGDDKELFSENLY